MDSLSYDDRIKQMVEKIMDVARGDFCVQIDSSGKNDELDSLVIGLNMMIDDLKNNTEKIQDYNQKLLEKNKEIENVLLQKDEFVNQLGHDLKNPLGTLLNLLPILEKRETDPKYIEILKILNKNTAHMKNLITRIIQLARLNSPNTEYSFNQINLDSILKEVIEHNKLMFRDNNIEIHNHLSNNITVNAEKILIQELFTNLLINSVKYTNGLGTLTIDSTVENNVLTVSIKDTGLGMTMDQVNRIFNKFYIANDAKNEFYSSGLGLPICKRIVEIHGGKIWVESEGLGLGSTFYFTLPLTT